MIMGYISTKLVHAALSAAALCLGAGSAGAVQYTVTYTGVVSDGIDRFGFFGVGTNLTGQNATIQYVVDTARGGQGSNDRRVLAGSSSTPSIFDLQPLYVVMTVGGTTKTFDYPSPQMPGVSGNGAFQNSDRTGPEASGGRTTQYYERDNSAGYPTGADSDASVGTSVRLGAAGASSPGFFDRSISAPFSLALTDASGFAFGSANFFFQTYTQLGQIADRQVTGNVTLDRITVGPLATAVPEPATWAMLIGGFALIGGTARRTRGAMTTA